ncbi:Lipase domain protein [Gracilaria domingensis]|nr:Lipase domain protein [Gracilaria domingensis]
MSLVAHAERGGSSYTVDRSDDVENWNVVLDDHSPSISQEVNSVRFLVPNLTSSHSDLTKPHDDFSVVSSEDVDIRESYGFSAARKEEAISINLSAKTFTKLEVIGAEEVTKLLWWFHGFILFGILFSIAFVVLANTVYLRLDSIRGTMVRYYNLPQTYEWVLSVANILCFFYAISLAIVFTSRMLRIRRIDRTHEQVWVILLTIAAAIYLNPYESVVRIMINADYNLREERWYDPISRMYDSVRDASFTASTLFYVWATVHSYRVLTGKLGVKFYVPKVLLVIVYMLLKQFAFWRFDIYMSEMPIASMVAMLHLYKTLNLWPVTGVVFVTLVTAFELILVAWIIREIRITRCFLKGKDYTKYRTKQIGIRFFLYHNLTFYVVFWLCYLLLLLGLPAGAQLAAMKVFEVTYVEVQYVPFGLSILYLSYVTVEAYMNLPSDAIGVRGWLHPQAPRLNGLLEPITYRKREPTSQLVQTNCFVMETHVIMFNFAWLVYYYNTPKMSKLSGMRNKFDYEVRKVVVDEGTDTRALIVDGDDRIVVAFRGTSSGRNLRTDLKAFHVQLNRILPTASGKNTTGELFGSIAQEVLESRDGQQAKVHRGFAEAYLSVADEVMHWIKELYDCDPRPVFLTGHSLGGALATICALDCALKYQLGTSDIYVATFGSPRVGNSAFRKVYDELVPASWRVSIAADIVTTLPKVDYQHVGKKIMLTTAGDLFIDPNSLELSMWSGDSLSFVHHRKASYLLAMRSWCNRHEKGAYRPLFWSWPFSADDERRWPAAISTDARDEVRREHRRHLLHQDAMIDALNETKADNIEERAFDNWSRLTRRLILNSAVHKT